MFFFEVVLGVVGCRSVFLEVGLFFFVFVFVHLLKSRLETAKRGCFTSGSSFRSSSKANDSDSSSVRKSCLWSKQSIELISSILEFFMMSRTDFCEFYSIAIWLSVTSSAYLKLCMTWCCGSAFQTSLPNLY